MSAEFIKQSGQPLFPDIFWDRPTMRSRGGHVLIVGGHKHEFSEIQALYQVMEAAGIGEVQAVVPDSLRKLIGEVDYIHYAPATTSGSLGKAATAEILELARDFDALIIGGNLTNNTETGVMIESLITQLDMPVIITEQMIEIVKFNPKLITDNEKALLVASMNGLFDLANNLKLPIQIKPNSGVVGKVDILNQIAAKSQCAFVIHSQELLIHIDGKTSITPNAQVVSDFPAIGVGLAATFWIQHRTKSFEALTTAAFIASHIEKPASYTIAADAINKSIRAFDK